MDPGVQTGEHNVFHDTHDWNAEVGTVGLIPLRLYVRALLSAFRVASSRLAHCTNLLVLKSRLTIGRGRDSAETTLNVLARRNHPLSQVHSRLRSLP